jgi:hypothetical protein
MSDLSRPAAVARASRLAALLVVMLAPLACEHNERTRDTTVLYGLIRAEYVAQDAVLCPCEVAEGKYKSVAECEARHALTDAELECLYGVFRASQDVVVDSLWCTLDAEEALSACVDKLACSVKDRPRLRDHVHDGDRTVQLAERGRGPDRGRVLRGANADLR